MLKLNNLMKKEWNKFPIIGLVIVALGLILIFKSYNQEHKYSEFKTIELSSSQFPEYAIQLESLKTQINLSINLFLNTNSIELENINKIDINYSEQTPEWLKKLIINHKGTFHSLYNLDLDIIYWKDKEKHGILLQKCIKDKNSNNRLLQEVSEIIIN